MRLKLARVFLTFVALAAVAATAVAIVAGWLQRDPAWPAAAALATIVVTLATAPLRHRVRTAAYAARLRTAATHTAADAGNRPTGAPAIREEDLRAAAALLGTDTVALLVVDPSRRQRLPSGDLLLVQGNRFRTHRVPLDPQSGESGLGFLVPEGVHLPANVRTKILTGQAGEVGRLIVGSGSWDAALRNAAEADSLLAVLTATWALRLDNQRLAAEAEARLLDIVESLIASVEAKDVYTSGHSKRVCRYSVLIAEQLGLTGRALDDIAIGAALHDVGKIKIPDHVLCKPGKMDDAEWQLMKSHPKVGARIVDSFNQSSAVLHIIFHHHERYDGRGYPAGLEGEAIPLVARIAAVADALDAMTSGRVYQRNRSLLEALDELRANAGKQFDPKVVEAALSLPRDQLHAVVPKLPTTPTDAPTDTPAESPAPAPALVTA